MRAFFIFFISFLILLVGTTDFTTKNMLPSEIKNQQYLLLLDQIREAQNYRLQLKQKLLSSRGKNRKEIEYELRYLRRLSNSQWSKKWQLLEEIDYLREIEGAKFQ